MRKFVQIIRYSGWMDGWIMDRCIGPDSFINVPIITTTAAAVTVVISLPVVASVCCESVIC